MTKVKICGITNLEDALLSAKFGADALGFNFYEKSPRYISPEKAREIIEQLPHEILKVGVFVNEDLDKIVEIANIAKLAAIQLHGEETPEFAKKLKAKTNLEIIKAFRVSSEFQPEKVLQYEVDAILLDTYNSTEHGGTGQTFDWNLAKKLEELKKIPKLYLAGGLSQDNLGQAIRLGKPFALDACSKLESKKGKKDKIKLINFISGVRNFDEIIINSETAPEGNERTVIKTVTEPFFYNLMKGFQTRPQMYFGKKALSLMIMYLHGFWTATVQFGIVFEDGFYPSGLNNWIRKSLTVEDNPSLHYSSLILEECGGDEEKAFDLFFALLEEFKLEKNVFSNE